MRHLAHALLILPAGLVIGTLLLGPLAWLLPLGFASGGGLGTGPGVGLTLANYQLVLSDEFYLFVFLRTAGTALAVTVLSVLIGWPLAYFLWRVGVRFRSVLTLIVVAPLLVSIPVRNYGWMIILGDHGLFNVALLRLGIISSPLELMYTQTAVVVALTHVLMPFVTLSVLASLDRVPPSLPEAAETLGASHWATVRHVLWPQTLPGVVAGASLVFCIAVSAYVTPALMGPSGAKYAAILIYQQFVSAFNWPRGTSIAMVLFAVTTAVLVVFLRRVRRDGGRDPGLVG